MGATCCKAAETNQDEAHPGGTLGVMFKRIDKDGKGYIDLRDLKALMKDDYKAYFQGRGAEHIMAKYGQDGQMSLENFRHWWNSTYTSYNDDAALAKTIDEVLLQLDTNHNHHHHTEKSENNTPTIYEELEQQQPVDDDEMRRLQDKNVPSNTNVAISRS
jgi:EF hand